MKADKIDFVKLNREIEAEQNGADAPVEFTPAPRNVIEPLPAEFQHLPDVSWAGGLAAEAVARAYLNAAEEIDKAGARYLEQHLAIRQSLIETGEALEKDARNVRAKYAAAAEKYREHGHDIFTEIENAAGRSDAALKICDDLHAVLDGASTNLQQPDKNAIAK